MIWVYIGEVFPNHVRSKGQGVGNASHWIMNTSHCPGVSGAGGQPGAQRALHLLCGNDGIAIRSGVFLLSRNQGPDTGATPAQAGPGLKPIVQRNITHESHGCICTDLRSHDLINISAHVGDQNGQVNTHHRGQEQGHQSCERVASRPARKWCSKNFFSWHRKQPELLQPWSHLVTISLTIGARLPLPLSLWKSYSEPIKVRRSRIVG